MDGATGAIITTKFHPAQTDKTDDESGALCGRRNFLQEGLQRRSTTVSLRRFPARYRCPPGRRTSYQSRRPIQDPPLSCKPLLNNDVQPATQLLWLIL